MNPVDEHTIHKMAEKFEWPDPVNNLWEKYTILVNSPNEDDDDDANNPLSLLSTLKSVLDSPIINDDFAKEEEKNRDRSINLESLLHNADNHLRKVANHIINSKDPSWRTQYAKSVSKVKAETLRMLHDILYKENSVWSIEDCQNLVENLFHEQLSKVLSDELLLDKK
ncbi:unnamed protein product [Trichobilharzia szidati]|nr:unnamed protein product [Trichobilharzia szidati]